MLLQTKRKFNTDFEFLEKVAKIYPKLKDLVNNNKSKICITFWLITLFYELFRQIRSPLINVFKFKIFGGKPRAQTPKQSNTFFFYKHVLDLHFATINGFR